MLCRGVCGVRAAATHAKSELTAHRPGATLLAENHSSGYVAALRDDAGLVTSRRGALQAALAGPPPPTARPRWTRSISPRLTAHYLDPRVRRSGGPPHHSGRDANEVASDLLARESLSELGDHEELAGGARVVGLSSSLDQSPARGAIQSGILSTGWAPP